MDKNPWQQQQNICEFGNCLWTNKGTKTIYAGNNDHSKKQNCLIGWIVRTLAVIPY